VRVSFLAVLAVALLVGLGSVVAIKTFGLLTPPKDPVPPPPAPLYTTPPPPPLVLVAIRPIFENDFIIPGDLGVRPVSELEMKYYKEHLDEYLPPVPVSAHYRFASRSIPGNQPLLKSDLQPVHKSEALHDRLLPGTEAVDVSVTKNNSAGWLISTGDWVNVNIITNVTRTDNPTTMPRVGLLVRHAKVIARRDSMVNTGAPVYSNVFPYTLAVNPYRKQLIEFAKDVGTITLSPVSKEEKEKLDALMKEVENDPAKADLITIGDVNSRDGMEELNRIKAIAASGLHVSNEDLARVLQLKPIEPPVALIPPLEVETFVGTSRTKSYSFPIAQDFPRQPAGQYIFSNPADSLKFVPGSKAPAVPGKSAGFAPRR
jgi:Flp pilus assembly protein CpaB